jgi:protein SCO1
VIGIPCKKTPEVFLCSLIAIGLLAAGCRRETPPRQYTLTGQVLAVHPDRQQITIRHEDVTGLMPGMTMTFPVATKELLTGRAPGELVSAQLEIGDAEGTLTGITRVGMAALPAGTNEVALASGILAAGDPLPDVALIDQNDRRRALSEWHGSMVLITFTYTRCPLPTFCLLMDQNFATIQRSAGEDAVLRDRVRLISISMDPEYDTPAVLSAHAARLKADQAVWTFLTGDRVTIDRVAGRFGVGVMRNPAVPTDITHNLRTVLAGPDGRVARIYSSNDWTPGKVLTDLRALLHQP